MASEETPLLTSEYHQNECFTEKNIYDRFSDGEKAMILATVSWCGLLPCSFSILFLVFVFLIIILSSLHCWIFHPRRAANCEGPRFDSIRSQVRLLSFQVDGSHSGHARSNFPA